MPETLIAIVALLDTDEGSEDVAIGAIVGAPFLLATLAMGLVGLFAYLYRDRRAQGVKLDAHAPTLERDLIFFLAFFGSPARSPGGRPRRCGSRPASPSCSPTSATSAAPCAAAARCRGRRR